MTEAIEAPQTLSPKQALDAIQKELPAQRGEYRRDHDVSGGKGSLWRINFHHEETNIIVRSFFIRVVGTKLVY